MSVSQLGDLESQSLNSIWLKDDQFDSPTFQALPSLLLNHTEEDSDFYLKLAKMIEETPDVTELFEGRAFKGKLRNEEMLRELLQDLSVHYGCDFEPACDYFAYKVNDDDSRDIVQVNELTESMLRRRLSNYCLTEACKLDKTSKQKPKQYIAQFRNPKTQVTIPPAVDEVSLVDSKADFIGVSEADLIPQGERFQMPPAQESAALTLKLAARAPSSTSEKSISSNRSRKPKQLPSSQTETNTTDVQKVSESLKVSIPSYPKEPLGPPPISTWLTPLLTKHSDQVILSFSSQVTSEDQEVSVTDCPKVFTEVLKICGVARTVVGNKLFQSLLVGYQKDFLTYLEFTALMNEWAAKYNPDTADITGKIKQTIKEYETLLTQMQPGGSYDALAMMVQTLKEQLRFHETKGTTKGKPKITMKELQAKGLKEIFAFYAKLQKVVGVAASFDSITQNNSVWTLGKFLKFCTDFDLVGKSGRGQRRVGREEVTAIFKKNAIHAKLLKEEAFLEVLEKVAEVFFNEEYDRVSGKPPVCSIGSKEKLEAILLYLSCDNAEQYQKKLKGFGQAFSSEKAGFRIPEDDLSKRYKYRPLPIRPRHKSVKAPSPELQQQSRVKARLLEASHSAVIQPPPIQAVRKASAPIPHTDPLPKQQLDQTAWRALESMEPDELGEEDVLKALGIEEADFEDSGYIPSSYQGMSIQESQVPAYTKEDKKLESTLKMHDRRIETGLRALDRVRRSGKIASRK